MGWFKLWAPSGAFDSRGYGKADCASSIVTPTADVQEFTVPGKNGTVIIPNNRWNNVDRTFSMFINLSDWSTVVGKLQECSSGYYMLEDSWNTDYFYMARLRSLELVNSTPALVQGTVQIVFDCQPVRWLTAGVEWAEYTAGDAIVNSGLVPMPVAVRVSPATPPYSGAEFKVTLSITFYNQADIASGYTSSHGVLVYSVDYPLTASSFPGKGNLIIDSLTHDCYCNSSDYQAGTTNVMYYITPSETQTGSYPPSVWPEIPAGWAIKIQVSDGSGSNQSLSVDVMSRGCKL